MTITIRRSTAVFAIALMGVLAGLALGQVTAALSAGGSSPQASASYTPPFERTLKQIKAELHEMHTVLGTSYGIYNVLDQLKDINSNTSR
jgi:hypothetical protein